MNKLRLILPTISVFALGCASAPPASEDAAPPATVEVAAKTAPAEGPTTLDTAPVDDDFWGTGTNVEIDDEGRILYASRIELVAGRGINDAYHTPRGHYDPNTVYIDPLTGRKVVLNHGPSAWRRVPRTVVAPPSQPTMSNAPTVSAPRPASTRMDGPRLRRGPDRGLRRER